MTIKPPSSLYDPSILANQDAVSINAKLRSVTSSSLLAPDTTSSDPTAVDTTDNVQLGLSKELQAQLDPATMATERQAKIAALTKSIQDGSYLKSVDPSAVAKSLVQESQIELLDSSRILWSDE